ncbi:MAG: hypothetical protein ACPL5F_07860 [Moorellaceae bacterium]
MASKEVLIERYYPLIGAVILSGLAFFLRLNIIKDYPLIVSNSITITSIFIGFEGTLAGVILGSNAKAIKFMKRIGKLQIVMRYLFESIQACFAFLAFSIALLFSPIFDKLIYVSLIWFFLGVFSALLTYRAITIAVILLMAAASEDEDNGKI